MALYLYVKEKNYSRKNIIFISLLLIGAAQFKLSFLLSSTIIGLLVLIKTFKNDKKNVFNLMAIFLLFFFPKFFYNYTQISSFNFINLFSSAPLSLLENLSGYSDNKLMFPLNLFIPDSPAQISTILGFHIFLLFFLKKISKNFKRILIITLFSIIVHFIFGQQVSRLYFEFILWIAVGFYFLTKESFGKKYLNYFIVPQLILVFISSLYFAIIAVPTFFSLEKRDKFMENNSSQYTGIKWTNRNIPNDAVIISQLRAVSLFKNKVIPHLNWPISFRNKERLIDFLKLNKPRFYVTKSTNLENFYFKNCLGNLYKVSDEIVETKRYPFNNQPKYKIYIYFFNYENLNFCVD